MKKDIFQKISLRVLLFLLVAAGLSVSGILYLESRTAKLEQEIREEMEADMILPLFFEDPEDSAVAIDDTTEGTENETSQPQKETEDSPETPNASMESEPSSEVESGDVEPDTTDASADETDEKDTDTSNTDKDQDKESSKKDDASKEDTKPEESQPTTPAPTTPAPTTPAPTTPAPTTPAPTTPAPTTPAPTTPAPTTPAPTTQAPPPPTTEAPRPVENPVPMSAAESVQYITRAQLDLFRNRVLTGINQVRAEAGVGPVTSDPCLESGAIIRSQEIVGTWSHTRPNGERGIYILAGCGGWYRDAVNAVKNNQAYNCALGENLAKVSSWSDYSGKDQEILALADDMVANWKASPTHYQNMISPYYKHIGLGVTVGMQDIFHMFYGCTLFSN